RRARERAMWWSWSREDIGDACGRELTVLSRNLQAAIRNRPLRAFGAPLDLTRERASATIAIALPRGQSVPMTRESGDLLQGTLGILILKALLPGAAHGYAVARWIEDATDDVLSIEEGSLYPALRRLEDRRWVSSEWGLSENNRRARFYSITAAGRKHLRDEAAVWLRYSQAVTR